MQHVSHTITCSKHLEIGCKIYEDKLHFPLYQEMNDEFEYDLG